MMMEPRERPIEKPPPAGPGIARDVRQLKVQGAASAAELREFFAQTRGRRPQEVLGMIAGSQLTRSMTVAALGTVLLLAAGTLIPWLIGHTRSSGRSEAAVPQAKSTESAAVAETDGVSSAKTVPAADPGPTPSPADTKRAMNAMGLGETKSADPKTNPLEHDLDNLLDKAK